MEYLSHILFVLGLIFIAAEVAIFGFSSLILLFAGVAFIIASLVFWLGILAPTLVAAVTLSISLTILFVLCLWRPLKNMQNKTQTKPIENDFTKHCFHLSADIDENTADVFHQYSGVQWQVRSHIPLKKDNMYK